jgi:hypothetical protein
VSVDLLKEEGPVKPMNAVNNGPVAGKSQRYYRLKFADSYYGEMTHYGLHRLAWADVRRTRN